MERSPTEETSLHRGRAGPSKAGISASPWFLATGNVRPVTYGLWRFLGLSAPMCCENGGVIWHPSWASPVVRGDGRGQGSCPLARGEIDGLNPNESQPTGGVRANGACSLTKISKLFSITSPPAQWPHLSVVRTGFAIHLMEPHLSKGEGLKVLFDRMGWSVDDALCVGRCAQRPPDV